MCHIWMCNIKSHYSGLFEPYTADAQSPRITKLLVIMILIEIESIKTTSMEDVRTRVFEKYKEYLRR